jgi:hypothetical protein
MSFLELVPARAGEDNDRRVQAGGRSTLLRATLPERAAVVPEVRGFAQVCGRGRRRAPSGSVARRAAQPAGGAAGRRLLHGRGRASAARAVTASAAGG